MYYFLEIDYACYIHVYFKRRKIYRNYLKTNLFRVDCVAVLIAWIWNMLFLLHEYESYLRHGTLKNLLHEYILCFIGPFDCYLYPVFANSVAHCNTAPRRVYNAIRKIFIIFIDYDNVNILTKTCSIIYLNRFLNAFISWFTCKAWEEQKNKLDFFRLVTGVTYFALRQ